MYQFQKADKIVAEFEKVIKKPIIPLNKNNLFVGVDLGTAYIVVVVLDENKKPIAGKYRFAKVIKDGIVVDYVGALQILKELKKEIEEELGCTLTNAAVAIPPGINPKDTKYIANVAVGAGFNVTNIVDEPTAANSLLQIKDGVIVDVGGGTTGLSIIKNGEVVYVADEATGGTHFTLVLAGANKISIDEAESLKKKKNKQEEIVATLLPVIQKVATIINNHINSYDIDSIYLVGGTCCLLDMEKIIEKEVGIKTYKPKNPLFITPIGIAMNCIN